MTMTARIAALAARAGMTEGQVWTVGIVFLSGLLLLPSLRSLDTRAAATPPGLPVAAAAPGAVPDGTTAPVLTGTATTPASTPGGATSGPGVSPPVTSPAAAGGTGGTSRPPSRPSTSGTTTPPAPAPAPAPPPTTAPTSAPAPAPPAPGAGLPQALAFDVTDTGPIAGLAVLPDGRAVVATSGQPDHLAYLTLHAPDGATLDRAFVGISPRQTVLGGVAVDGDRVLLVNTTDASLLAYDPTSTTLTELADIPDLPACLFGGTLTGCELTLQDRRPAPTDVAVGPDGTIWVADGGQGTVWRVSPDGTEVLAWHSSPEYAALGGITVDADGRVLVVADDVLTALVARSTIHALVEQAGTVARTIVTTSTPGTAWADLVVLADGSLATAAPASGMVTVIAADGVATTTLAEADGSALTAPTALAARGSNLVVGDVVGEDGPHRVVETTPETPEGVAPDGP